MAKKNFSDEQWDKFTDELKEVLNFIENTLTYEHPVLSINENYFLLAILQEQNCLAYKIIDALISSTAIKLIHDAYFRIVTKGQLTAIKPNRTIPFDTKFYELIDEGNEEMKKIGDEKLSTIHIVLALINPNTEHQNVQKIMKSAGLNYNLLSARLASLKDTPSQPASDEIIEKTVEIDDSPVNMETKKKKKNIQNFEFELQGIASKPITGQYLTTYCQNLNKKAKDGKIDPVIGRDKEIERITKIFNRRRKNNVVIVGDKGSGKTAICESLAWLITNNQAPYSLQDKTILKLDVSAMIAGTTYRGMFEERAKGVFTELQKNPKCILFVDDFHTQTAKPDSESSTDITPYLKEVISDGSVKVIVTCSPKGYHKKFDGDQSLANKFQRIDLVQLQEDEIKTILMNVKTTYENYHAITISEQIIDLCISLCKKYVTDRDMPDSVIDLIDEIGASVSKKYEESQEVKELKEEILALAYSKKDAIKNEKFDEVDSIVEKETKKNKQLKEKEKKHKCDVVTITDEMVYSTISDKTGIPIQNLSDENKKDLATINERLKQVIIGQDDAIDKVCKTIKRKRLGLHNGRGTAMFFQGTTGCGKTFLAKKLAEELFGSETAMVRFDMSEYSDKTSVHKLIGCFTPEMKVLMSDGSYKDIQFINVGDSVITPNGNIKKVLNKFEYSFKGFLDVYRVASNNQFIKCTPNHEILAIKPLFYTNGRFKKESYDYSKSNFIESKNINAKDIVLYPRKLNFIQECVKYDLFDFVKHLPSYICDNKYVWSNRKKDIIFNRYINFDEKLSRLLGYYIAEGSITKNFKTISFSFNIEENGYVKEVIELMKDIFNFNNYHITKNEKRHNCVISFSNRAICCFISKLCGRCAFEKQIPKEMFKLTKQTQINLIETAFFGDGTKSCVNSTRYTTTSIKLGEQITTLLRNLGYNAQMQIHTPKNIKWNKQFYIYLTGNDIDKFNLDMPNLRIKRYNKHNKYIKRNHYIDDKFFYYKITHKSQEYYDGKVYDLTIEDDSCYIVNSMSVHNSSPGYVGYEEGGLLTEAIKNKKHCILLLDEIEKADNEIFNIFLQVFDEGFLTDNTGQKVDFRNVITLLTSNVGAREATNNSRIIGFNQTKTDEIKKTNSILDKELKKRFAPEFLNRLDGIIYFNALTEDSLKRIVKLEVDKSVKRFNDIGYEIIYDDTIIEHIYQIIKDESEYGARPIIRAVQNEMEDPLTDAILDGPCNKQIKIYFKDDSIVVDCQ